MTLVMAIFFAPFAVLTLCFAVEVFVGLVALRRPVTRMAVISRRDPQAVVVIPAHNEATILRPRLEALKEAATAQARILLVADNCSDRTAEIARQLGIQVAERFDVNRRGKGFALDFARCHLRSDPPDVVVIIDADCTLDATSLQALIRYCYNSGRPCQATNLQRPSPNATPLVQLSTFAFFVKNVIRQRALMRLVGRAHLLGTGMAFPWSIFDRAELATANIVEDLKLGNDLAKIGRGPVFIEDPIVWSSAETQSATLSQRSRWEGGFLRHGIRSGLPMLVQSLISGDVRGLWTAVNVLIPPFALLLLFDFALLVLGMIVTSLTGAHLWPVVVLGTAVLLAAAGLSAAWLSGGWRFIKLSAIIRAPLYLLWKMPMYLRFAREGSPKEWTRTNRSDTPKEI